MSEDIKRDFNSLVAGRFDPIIKDKNKTDETQRALSILLSIAEDDSLNLDIRIDACRAILGK